MRSFETCHIRYQSWPSYICPTSASSHSPPTGLGRCSDLSGRPSAPTVNLKNQPYDHLIAYANMSNFIAQILIPILEDLKQLRVLEVLEVLESDPTFISARFLKCFAQISPSSTPILAPNLYTLLFHYSQNTDFDSFARALQSRCLPGSQVILKTVTILCPECNLGSTLENFQTSPWWDQLRDVGIDMQLQALESYAVRWGF
ncbi:hypothetical protein FIBSPDRAFT_313809 [Athelia psychrophila]|uniref:Uncharacterized protein n=1 Tax=Athelia psychrophila TaxID=1759441 RepID=A0A166QLI2_9AGAM|nr:hypothetical protein FIBSPDRAFT_313809 [Fibularhizoctonia sp. CBS 109695]